MFLEKLEFFAALVGAINGLWIGLLLSVLSPAMGGIGLLIAGLLAVILNGAKETMIGAKIGIFSGIIAGLVSGIMAMFVAASIFSGLIGSLGLGEAGKAAVGFFAILVIIMSIVFGAIFGAIGGVIGGIINSKRGGGGSKTQKPQKAQKAQKRESARNVQEESSESNG